jgi:hypothetical protein
MPHLLLLSLVVIAVSWWSSFPRIPVAIPIRVRPNVTRRRISSR